MFRSGIKISREPVTLSIARTSRGRLRITQPRAGWLLAAALLSAVGAAIWLVLRPEDPWRDLSHYLIGVLLVAPGLWALGKGIQPRPLVVVCRGELVVSYGPTFVERTVARLPLKGLEVRVRAETVMAAGADADAIGKRLVSVRLFSMLNPVPAGGAAEKEVKLHVLEVRNAGQEQWLGVLGSQVASEIENARLAIAAETGEVEVEIEDDDAAIHHEEHEGHEDSDTDEH